MEFNNLYYCFLIFIFLHLFIYQINLLKIKNPNICLKIFKSNNLLGLIVTLNIFVGKFF